VQYSLPLIPGGDSSIGLLINLFSGVWEWKRTIKQHHAIEFISKIRHQLPDLPITLCSEAHTFAYANEIRKQLLADGILIKVIDASQEGYMGLLNLCASAKLILSPDTAVVHLASALNKPIVGIYQNDGIKSTLWAPTSDIKRIILSQSIDSIDGYDIDEVVSAIIELNERIEDA
jgi:ADP-heptose:LPS heptosyltransferase